MSKRGFPGFFFENAFRSNFVFYVFQFIFLNQWSEGTESVFESVTHATSYKKVIQRVYLNKESRKNSCVFISQMMTPTLSDQI